MKKAVVMMILFTSLISCNKTYEKALKSKDSDYILNAANELYAKEKWPYAIDLYQKVSSAFAGTQESENIAYNSAYANFNDENYSLAAKQFKNFYITYGRSERAEEALFMSAFSYYKGSPEYNLDQTNTYEAMTELQGFISAYPTSPRVKEINGFINELQQKLEEKYFAIAKSYYVTLKYKAATVAFANFIDDFPDSKLREEANLYLLRSRSELALQSIHSKKDLRLKDALTTYKLFTKTYPESQYLKEAQNWQSKLDKATTEHQNLLKQLEEQKKTN